MSNLWSISDNSCKTSFLDGLYGAGSVGIGTKATGKATFISTIPRILPMQ